MTNESKNINKEAFSRL